MSTLTASHSSSREFMPEDSLTVRKSSHADIEDALRLIEEYYDAIDVVLRDDREALLHTLEDPMCGIWTAYIGSTPAGCVMLRPLPGIPRTGEVKRLYVRPNFRGRGIARVLMQSLEEDAKALGMDWLYLDTKDDLKAAIHFYEEQGYQRCARYNSNPQATIFMRKSLLPGTIVVRTFQPGDELAFCVLNEAWISAYFKIEKKDREILDNPAEIILKPGGQIFFAFRGEKALGCCALIRMEDGSFEVSKMAVAEEERGQGIGRRVLQAAVDYARERGICRLYLETNSKLAPAIHLYKALGFKEVPETELTPSPYARADVFLEMYLGKN